MKKRFLFGKNWFFEEMKLGESPTFTWGVIPGREIFLGKSQFQRIEIFETKEFGRILALDGLIQLSTEQEFVYHEMLVQPAMFYYWAGSGRPSERILIIGGGDGGALREIVKHKSVKEIFLVDLDKKVIAVSKRYLPSVSQGAFKDKRLKIFNEDALKFIKKYKKFFDVIVCDLTDPTGPSLRLWSAGFYRDILRALKGTGIAAFQTACFKERFGQKARKRIKRFFPFFKVHRAFVGCFPFDEHTFSFGSKKINFNKVTFGEIKSKYRRLSLKTKYYSPEIHFSSAVLPRSAK
jgi:spermidine synthase